MDISSAVYYTVAAVIGAVLGCAVAYLTAKSEPVLAGKKQYEQIRFLNISGKKKHLLNAAAYATLAVMGALIMLLSPGDINIVHCFLLLFYLSMASSIDFKYRRIPDELHLYIVVTTVILCIPSYLDIDGFVKINIVSSLLGAVVSFLLFCIPGFTGKSVGGADIKLAAALGFVLGLKDALICFALMGVIVIAYEILSAATQLKTAALMTGEKEGEDSRYISIDRMLKDNIPMGPPLALGAMAIILAGYTHILDL